MCARLLIRKVEGKWMNGYKQLARLHFFHCAVCLDAHFTCTHFCMHFWADVMQGLAASRQYPPSVSLRPLVKKRSLCASASLWAWVLLWNWANRFAQAVNEHIVKKKSPRKGKEKRRNWDGKIESGKMALLVFSAADRVRWGSWATSRGRQMWNERRVSLLVLPAHTNWSDSFSVFPLPPPFSFLNTPYIHTVISHINKPSPASPFAISLQS